MTVRYTQGFLDKLESIIGETAYMLRYEKGNFKPGYCILNETKIIIINKYFSLEGKINCLIDILKILDLNSEKLSEKNQKLYLELCQTALKF